MLVLASLILAQTAITPGTYVTEGGWGSLELKKSTFHLQMLGGNAHTCELEGTWKGTQAQTKGDEGVCKIELKLHPGGGIEVDANQDDEACRQWCGMRAWFADTFYTQPTACKPKALSLARASFAALYREKKYAEAKAVLAPLIESCGKTGSKFEVAMWLNDLAITQHHLGDDQGCVKTLEPWAELASAAAEDIGMGEPAYEEPLKRIARATRTNLKLCGAFK